MYVFKDMYILGLINILLDILYEIDKNNILYNKNTHTLALLGALFFLA